MDHEKNNLSSSSSDDAARPLFKRRRTTPPTPRAPPLDERLRQSLRFVLVADFVATTLGAAVAFTGIVELRDTDEAPLATLFQAAFVGWILLGGSEIWLFVSLGRGKVVHLETCVYSILLWISITSFNLGVALLWVLNKLPAGGSRHPVMLVLTELAFASNVVTFALALALWHHLRPFTSRRSLSPRIRNPPRTKHRTGPPSSQTQFFVGHINLTENEGRHVAEPDIGEGDTLNIVLRREAPPAGDEGRSRRKLRPPETVKLGNPPRPSPHPPKLDVDPPGAWPQNWPPLLPPSTRRSTRTWHGRATAPRRPKPPDLIAEGSAGSKPVSRDKSREAEAEAESKFPWHRRRPPPQEQQPVEEESLGKQGQWVGPYEAAGRSSLRKERRGGMEEGDRGRRRVAFRV